MTVITEKVWESTGSAKTLCHAPLLRPRRRAMIRRPRSSKGRRRATETRQATPSAPVSAAEWSLSGRALPPERTVTKSPSPYAPIVNMPSRSILRCQQALNAAQTTGTAKVMAKATAVLSTRGRTIT